MSRVLAAVEKLNWAFKLYDIDNDGLVDLHEMAVHLWICALTVAVFAAGITWLG